MLSKVFSFPNPVNEVASRFTAGVVAILGLISLITGFNWIILVMAFGFIARVLSGPSLSPLAMFAVKVFAKFAPFKPKYSPGPPKRFAQGIGAFVTILAAIFSFGFGINIVSQVLISVLVVFASLESGFGLCVGCKMFALLMKLHVIPESVCVECADLTKRYPVLAQ